MQPMEVTNYGFQGKQNDGYWNNTGEGTSELHENINKATVIANQTEGHNGFTCLQGKMNQWQKANRHSPETDVVGINTARVFMDIRFLQLSSIMCISS
ncbi:hypothetical protein RND71_017752 [Anisodus tanguticus]|uniref:Uncharacterized protein n=1 Tax=Anisodus tanguticus TaxID=243964 RepID=A0AAE1S4S0_9SOLA|nr:hypothetical protein RND71_017752 [Anisodus tanguticus]